MHIVYAGCSGSEPVIGVLDWDASTEHDSLLSIQRDPEWMRNPSEHLNPSACIMLVPGTPDPEIEGFTMGSSDDLIPF